MSASPRALALPPGSRLALYMFAVTILPAMWVLLAAGTPAMRTTAMLIMAVYFLGVALWLVATTVHRHRRRRATRYASPLHRLQDTENPDDPGPFTPPGADDYANWRGGFADRLMHRWGAPTPRGVAVIITGLSILSVLALLAISFALIWPEGHVGRLFSVHAPGLPLWPAFFALAALSIPFGLRRWAIATLRDVKRRQG